MRDYLDPDHWVNGGDRENFRVFEDPDTKADKYCCQDCCGVLEADLFGEWVCFTCEKVKREQEEKARKAWKK